MLILSELKDDKEWTKDETIIHAVNDYGRKEFYGLFSGGKDSVTACNWFAENYPELFKGIWGVKDFRNYNQEGFFELSRLCLNPDYQGENKNTASWFVSKCIKKLKKELGQKKKRVKAILSYADSNYHNGTVYAAIGFKYYGLSAPKYNIWIPNEKGKRMDVPERQEKYWTQKSRGWREWLDKGGVKIARGQKHRFLITFDNKLKRQIKWREQKWQPSTKNHG